MLFACMRLCIACASSLRAPVCHTFPEPAEIIDSWVTVELCDRALLTQMQPQPRKGCVEKADMIWLFCQVNDGRLCCCFMLQVKLLEAPSTADCGTGQLPRLDIRAC